MSHSPTPWQASDSGSLWDANNCIVAELASMPDAAHIVACVNACAGIATEALDVERIVACCNACAGIDTEALTNLDWHLAPKQGARPADVAGLLLKLKKYEDALKGALDFASHLDRGDFVDLTNRLDDIRALAQDALQP